MKKCPHKGFKPCIERECSFWVDLQVKNTPLDTPRLEGRCKDAWSPVLTTETNTYLMRIDAEISSLRAEANIGKKTVGELMSLLRIMMPIAEGNRELLLNADRQAENKQTLLLDKQPD